MTKKNASVKTFTSMKFHWLDQALADSGITRLDFAVAYVLCHKLNSRTGVGGVSMAEIANGARCTRQAAHQSVGRLTKRGFLAVQTGRGQGVPNTYRLTFPGGVDVNPTLHKTTPSDGTLMSKPLTTKLPPSEGTFVSTCVYTESSYKQEAQAAANRVIPFASPYLKFQPTF